MAPGGAGRPARRWSPKIVTVATVLAWRLAAGLVLPGGIV